jgi:anti-sigma-K factor RskA
VNVKEYISSGIIESYVLGMATDAERTEFEAICVSYPEVAAARDAFERELEARLLQDAPPAPAHLKAAILGQLSPAEPQLQASQPVAEEAPVRRMAPWKWLAAASLVLLAGTAYWAFSTQQQYRELQASNQNLQQQLSRADSTLQALRTDASLLQKPEMKMAAMTGTSNPAIYATIYWDTTSKDVYLMVNNLPKPATDQQYQLWALLDGKPIDLGMIEARQERLLYRMKNVREAQAFAITLEPKGGSPAPTNTPIVVSNL